MHFWNFGAIFVDFSEARDLFGINFQIPGSDRNFLDCGLITKKHGGFFGKTPGNNELTN